MDMKQRTQTSLFDAEPDDIFAQLKERFTASRNDIARLQSRVSFLENENVELQREAAVIPGLQDTNSELRHENEELKAQLAEREAALKETEAFLCTVKTNEKSRNEHVALWTSFTLTQSAHVSKRPRSPSLEIPEVEQPSLKRFKSDATTAALASLEEKMRRIDEYEKQAEAERQRQRDTMEQIASFNQLLFEAIRLNDPGQALPTVSKNSLVKLLVEYEEDAELSGNEKCEDIVMNVEGSPAAPVTAGEISSSKHTSLAAVPSASSHLDSANPAQTGPILASTVQDIAPSVSQFASSNGVVAPPAKAKSGSPYKAFAFRQTVTPAVGSLKSTMPRLAFPIPNSIGKEKENQVTVTRLRDSHEEKDKEAVTTAAEKEKKKENTNHVVPASSPGAMIQANKMIAPPQPQPQPVKKTLALAPPASHPPISRAEAGTAAPNPTLIPVAFQSRPQGDSRMDAPASVSMSTSLSTSGAGPAVTAASSCSSAPDSPSSSMAAAVPTTKALPPPQVMSVSSASAAPAPASVVPCDSSVQPSVSPPTSGMEVDEQAAGHGPRSAATSSSSVQPPPLPQALGAAAAGPIPSGHGVKPSASTSAMQGDGQAASRASTNSNNAPVPQVQAATSTVAPTSTAIPPTGAQVCPPSSSSSAMQVDKVSAGIPAAAPAPAASLRAASVFPIGSFVSGTLQIKASGAFSQPMTSSSASEPVKIESSDVMLGRSHKPLPTRLKVTTASNDRPLHSAAGSSQVAVAPGVGPKSPVQQAILNSIAQSQTVRSNAISISAASATSSAPAPASAAGAQSQKPGSARAPAAVTGARVLLTGHSQQQAQSHHIAEGSTSPIKQEPTRSSLSETPTVAQATATPVPAPPVPKVSAAAAATGSAAVPPPGANLNMASENMGSVVTTSSTPAILNSASSAGGSQLQGQSQVQSQLRSGAQSSGQTLQAQQNQTSASSSRSQTQAQAVAVPASSTAPPKVSASATSASASAPVPRVNATSRTQVVGVAPALVHPPGRQCLLCLGLRQPNLNLIEHRKVKPKW
ncbi:hypothetical protein CPB84DRAFT_1846399 [Gymnopilus junonius]|uniref:Uncharacterized protein n=1 Tax=Gymnopilus junonius TaxID=109634 RepID=A0A9P5NMC6_GYMJU|nr:hypothetical protein CPB84DRAFT_1846399 [Gymnopilus junonius]